MITKPSNLPPNTQPNQFHTHTQYISLYRHSRRSSCVSDELIIDTLHEFNHRTCQPHCSSPKGGESNRESNCTQEPRQRKYKSSPGDRSGGFRVRFAFPICRPGEDWRRWLCVSYPNYANQSNIRSARRNHSLYLTESNIITFYFFTSAQPHPTRTNYRRR